MSRRGFVRGRLAGLGVLQEGLAVIGWKSLRG